MRRLLLLTVALTFGAGVVIACNSADFTPATPKDCTKVECDCEEDPSQPTCVGIPGAPEGGLEGGGFDATLDADLDTGIDAPDDAAEDAADDAADAADQ